MHFYNLIKKIAEKNDILLYVDMDGVIASYDAGKPLDYENKRPVMENIRKIKKVSEIPNVELFILSICMNNEQIQEKNNWLDKYADFFKYENRVIISKEKNVGISSPEIKTNYLKNLKSNKQIILLDDDNRILKNVLKNAENVIALQDSELID